MPQIATQVIDVLDADREPDQRVVDAERRAQRRRNGAVRHQCGMLDQALDAAEALGERKEAAMLEEAPGAGEIGLQSDRHHAAESAHLTLGERMLRMRSQAWVIDLRHFGLRFEPLRELERIGAMLLHPERERLQATQREEAVERADDPSDS